MKSRKTLFSLVAAVGLTLCAGAGGRAQQPAPQTYVLTDIMFANDEGFGSFKVGINATGTIAVSTKGTGTVLQPYLWTPDQPNGAIGTVRPMRQPANAVGSWCTGINASGQVAGYSELVVGIARVLAGQRWEINGNPTAITSPTGGGKDRSRVWGINDSGSIVGSVIAKASSSEWRPFLWKNGKLVDLSNGLGGDYLAINAGGKVIGNWFNGPSRYIPFLWTPSQPNGTSGTFTTLPFGYASAINDLGQIAGYDDQGLLLYRPGVGVQYLGAPTTPTSRGWASALNNAGQVVGTLSSYVDGVEIDRAFLWDATNGLRDLNDPARVTLVNPDLTPAAGWVVNFATGINGTGQIAGYGTDPSGQHRIILLTPQ